MTRAWISEWWIRGVVVAAAMTVAGSGQMANARESFLDVDLPMEWAVYGPVPSIVPARPESDISMSQPMPETLIIGNQTYSRRMVKPEDGSVNLAALFPQSGKNTEMRTGDWAYLTGEIQCKKAGTLLIGAGADWWMQWVIDGKPVFDTLGMGNEINDFSVFDHVFRVNLEPGTHSLCVVVKAGSAGWKFAAGTDSKHRKQFIQVEKKQRGRPRDAKEAEALMQAAAKTNSHMKLVIYGSSVASGAGAVDKHGWAYRLTPVLEKRNWTVVNKSIGGDTTTKLLARFKRDLLPEKPDMVIIGLSLANEGLVTSPTETYARYVRNMHKLIQLCHKHGIVPIVSGCYPNNAFNRSHYDAIRSFNAELNAWPVASINFLGSVDTGEGHWPADCWKDGAHPNERGHEEMFYSIPPSMFDMMIDPYYALPPPTRSWMRYVPDPGVKFAPLKYRVVDPMHSFSLAFTVKVPHVGATRSVLAAVDGNVLCLDRKGQFTYESDTGAVIQTDERAKAGRSYHLALTHSYINQQTRIWVDGRPAGTVAQRLSPAVFALAGSLDEAGGEASYRDFLLYRGCFDGEQVNALAGGQILRSSLELFAPLSDHHFTSGLPVFNAAQTESRLEMTGETCHPTPGEQAGLCSGSE